MLASIVKENSNSTSHQEQFSMLLGDIREKSIIKHSKEKQDIKIQTQDSTIVKNIYNLVKEQIVEDSPMALISASKKSTIYKEISKILTRKQEITTKEIKMLASIVKENSNSTSHQEQFSMLLGDIREKSIIKHSKEKQDIKTQTQDSTIVKNIYNLVKEQIVEDSPMALISASKKSTIYKEISKILTRKQEITTKEIKMLASIVKENSNSINFIKHSVDSEKYSMQNNNFNNMESDIKYISASGKTINKDSQENSFMKNLGVGRQHKEIVNTKKENLEEYVSKTVLEKKVEVENHINSVVVNMDDTLDELALKIFREIKDEISMEYRR